MYLANQSIWYKGTLLPPHDEGTGVPIKYRTWAPKTGRVLSGKTVGPIAYWKYKIPLKWSFLTEIEFKKLKGLFENKPDYGSMKFYDVGKLVNTTGYASDLTHGGIVCAGNEDYYKDISVNIVEQ